MNGDLAAASEASSVSAMETGKTAFPTGYKQSDAGIIPEDWGASTIGSEFSVQLGKMLDSEKNTGELKPYIGNRAVQWDRIDTSELQTVPMTSSDLQKFRLQKGDILVCEGGEVGRSAIWDAPFEECYYQKALHRLRPVNGFNAKLVVAILRRLSDNGILKNYATQTSIAHLPRDKFITVPIPVPPKNEQRAIAAALSDVDALLEELDRLIAKKRDLKQATMQQLLTGQTRLPGFAGAWCTLPISEMCSQLATGKLDANAMIKDGEYRFYTCAKDYYFIDTYAFDCEALLISGNGANVGYIHYYKGKFNAYQRTYVLSGFSASIKYVQRYLEQKLAERIEVEVKAGGTPYITKSTISDMSVCLPPTIDEQDAIADVLQDMEREIEALERCHQKTSDLKRAMMQDLLKGRVRLIDPSSSGMKTC